MNPALDAGMRTLLARRAEALAGGAVAVGWKVGLTSPAMQGQFGLDGPVVGYLTDATVVPAGTTVEIGGWQRPALEVEVAIRVGTHGGVAALAPALELVDLDPAADGLEQMLAGNVFHRGVVFGPELETAWVDALEVVVEGGVERLRASGRLTESAQRTVEVVGSFLAAYGAELLPGDRIIAGSLVAPLALEPGDEVQVGFGALGALTARFS
jgi:2-keto-4-pentenoate hydratase